MGAVDGDVGMAPPALGGLHGLVLRRSAYGLGVDFDVLLVFIEHAENLSVEGVRIVMSLRSRVAALLVALSMALAGIMYSTQQWVVMPTFVDIERMAAELNVNRCVEALQRDLQSLANTTSDWAYWDDTYRYVYDRNEQYEQVNLSDDSFLNARLNLICLLDNDRQLAWGECRDNEQSRRLELPKLFADLQDPHGPLADFEEDGDGATGIVVTDHGPMLLASRPILNNTREGPRRGTLIMGRFLSPKEIADLAERTQVYLTVWTVGKDRLPALVAQIVDGGLADGATLLTNDGPEILAAYYVFKGVDGKPALVMRLDLPRVLTAQGRVAAGVATACMIAGSAVTLAAVWLMLQRGVVSPLGKMAEHVTQLGQSGDLDARLQLQRSDEIGTLANAFDGMVERIQHIAFHDALTDLPNRAYLMERLRSCVARSRRDRDYRFGVLFVDVDNFKLINDSLGHRVGDQLLTHMAAMMVSVLGVIRTSPRRSQDTVARLGGDEFVVLLDDVGEADNVMRIAERIREHACCTVDFGNRRISPGLSMGAVISTIEYEDPVDLLRDADTALYHAKGEGKGKIALFDQAMRSRVLERADLESDLQLAVAHEDFFVHYQPIVALEDNRLHCLEALVRWNHPTRGLISPDEFIAVAEQNGLIESIGEQVLEQVCRQMAEWRAAGHPLGEVSVSVNVAARQFVGDRLVSQIDACLDRYDLDASALKIELTETTAIRAIDASRCVFEALTQRGIEIYLDDFGTGYSSLGTLHTLPFSAIKLDRSFIKGLEAEPENETTVRAMVMIAENRGIRLIAEGIETSEQLATLRALDCRHGQGFLFSRPLPAAELERLVENDWQRAGDAAMTVTG